MNISAADEPAFRRIRTLLCALNIDTDLRAVSLLGMTVRSEPHPVERLRQRGYSLADAAGTNPLFKWVAPRLGVDRIDREQRDYVFPQLIEVGLIEKVYVLPADEANKRGIDIERGRHEPKSPNNAYTATFELVDLLAVPDEKFARTLDEFLAGDTERRRKVAERKAAAAATGPAANKHATLIRACVDQLLLTAATKFTLAFIDDADGDRIRDEYRRALEPRNLLPNLASKWPDAILVCDAGHEVWFVDAVTGDGEIDISRRDALVEWASDRGWAVVGVTTAYRTWKRAKERQEKHRNLAPGTSLWIAEDGGKLFFVDALVPDAP